jgi:hypothetical protein
MIKALDGEGLSVRSAQRRMAIAAADFSRTLNADLGRFTVDRLMSIINRLGSRLEVKIKVGRAKSVEHVLCWQAGRCALDTSKSKTAVPCAILPAALDSGQFTANCPGIDLTKGL